MPSTEAEARTLPVLRLGLVVLKLKQGGELKGRATDQLYMRVTKRDERDHGAIRLAMERLQYERALHQYMAGDYDSQIARALAATPPVTITDVFVCLRGSDKEYQLAMSEEEVERYFHAA